MEIKGKKKVINNRNIISKQSLNKQSKMPQVRVNKLVEEAQIIVVIFFWKHKL